MLDYSPLARLYALRRIRALEHQDAEAAQRLTLQSLIAEAQSTTFGKAHAFSRINGVAAFQARVPLRSYEAFWHEWWQDKYPDLVDLTWPGKIPFFSMTSGTSTGRSKYIPYTFAMRRAAMRGFVDLLSWHMVNRPQSRAFGGSMLGLTGPAELGQAGQGAAVGPVSAITLSALPRFLQGRVLPSPELAMLDDWREKIRRLAPLALSSDLRMLGGSPNWMLILLDEVARAADRGEVLHDWFPNLELIVHGGLNFAPYADRLRRLMAGGHAETREIYSASEGVFAVADADPGEGLRLHLDGQIFYEFVPPDEIAQAQPTRHWIATVETERDYALVISTAAGLWAYPVGDLVRLVSRRPPRLVVTGRLGKSLSAFGEHLIEDEIAAAVAAAARATGVGIADYSVFASHGDGPGRHVYYVETDPALDRAGRARFPRCLDEALLRHNADYSELREGDLSIGPPEVHFAAPGAFAEWMEQRRHLGGQNKVPRIMLEPNLAADLASFMERRETGVGQ